MRILLVSLALLMSACGSDKPAVEVSGVIGNLGFTGDSTNSVPEGFVIGHMYLSPVEGHSVRIELFLTKEYESDDTIPNCTLVRD